MHALSFAGTRRVRGFGRIFRPESRNPMTINNSVLELIGNTPIVKAQRLDAGVCELFLKLESANPGGSIKDRIGLSMIESAERAGKIKPGDTLVEGTAGNTGIGLALVAQQKGYRLILVVPDKMSREKIFNLKAMGAEVVLTRSDVAKGHPQYYQDMAERLARETDGAYFINQFGNPDNPRAHEEGTGPEILAQMDGKLDAIVFGCGSSGTMTGLSRHFAKAAPAVEQRVDLDLNSKRVLIAGASRGIGHAMTEAFLKEGARVVMLARDSGKLDEAVGQLRRIYGKDRVLAFSMDCADVAAWPDVISGIESAWGGLDIVIANVGDGRGPQDALPDADRFRTAWRTNFTTAEETARATLPMLEADGGCLLFVSSIAGLEAIGAPTDYSVVKAALIALTKQMARRLAPRVRVNCLAPGNVHFPGGGWDAKMKEDPHRVEASIQATVPMRRFGSPAEIADAGLFLCSARAT